MAAAIWWVIVGVRACLWYFCDDFISPLKKNLQYNYFFLLRRGSLRAGAFDAMQYTQIFCDNAPIGQDSDSRGCIAAHGEWATRLRTYTSLVRERLLY